MQKCWSSDPFFRPDAKDLDIIFADMSANDGEPLIDEGNTRLRKEVATGDMLCKVFPKKVAGWTIGGAVSCCIAILVLSSID